MCFKLYKKFGAWQGVRAFGQIRNALTNPITEDKQMKLFNDNLVVEKKNGQYVDTSRQEGACPHMFGSVPDAYLLTPPPLSAFDDVFMKSKYGGYIQ